MNIYSTFTYQSSVDKKKDRSLALICLCVCALEEEEEGRRKMERIDDAIDKEGNTRLISSIEGFDCDAMTMYDSIRECTLELGADISLRNNDGKNALDCLRFRYLILQRINRFHGEDLDYLIIKKYHSDGIELLESLTVIDAQYFCQVVKLVGIVVIDNVDKSDNNNNNNSSKKVPRQFPTVLVEMIGSYVVSSSSSPPAYRKRELEMVSTFKN